MEEAKRKNVKKENYLSRTAIEIDNSKKHINICSKIILLQFFEKVKRFFEQNKRRETWLKEECLPKRL